jgi:hypothetical protein
VYVDRGAFLVLQVEDVDPVGRRGAAQLQRLLAADLVRRECEAAVHVGVARHHGDQVQLGIVAQGLGEQLGHLG